MTKELMIYWSVMADDINKFVFLLEITSFCLFLPSIICFIVSTSEDQKDLEKLFKVLTVVFASILILSLVVETALPDKEQLQEILSTMEAGK